ncbi:MAG: glycosyl transferase, partial [Anaerolineales bacterium]
MSVNYDKTDLYSSTSTLSSLKLGEALIQRGWLTPVDLEKALEIQRRTGERLGRIFIALGIVRRQQLYRVLAELWQLPFVDLLQTPVEKSILDRFDAQLLVSKRFFPFALTDNIVRIATAEKPSPELDKIIQEVMGDKDIEYYVTTEWDIDYAVRTYFREQILDRAIFGLYYRNPSDCAYTVLTKWQY